MKYKIESDYPVTNEAAKKATGKTMAEWFEELDAWNGLEKGRRTVNNYLYEKKIDPWWCTTVAVEYEKHHGHKKKDGLYEGYFVCSTKTINASPADVFRAWSDKAMLHKWFGQTTKAEVKEGGALQTQDGDAGKILRVRENKDIRIYLENAAFSHPIVVDVQFQDKGKGKTGLLVNLTRIQTRAEADGVRNAWAEALDRLKAACES